MPSSSAHPSKYMHRSPEHGTSPGSEVSPFSPDALPPAFRRPCPAHDVPPGQGAGRRIARITKSSRCRKAASVSPRSGRARRIGRARLAGAGHQPLVGGAGGDARRARRRAAARGHAGRQRDRGPAVALLVGFQRGAGRRVSGVAPGLDDPAGAAADVIGRARLAEAPAVALPGRAGDRTGRVDRVRVARLHALRRRHRRAPDAGLHVDPAVVGRRIAEAAPGLRDQVVA